MLPRRLWRFGLAHIDPVQDPRGWTKGNILNYDWIDSDGKGNINHLSFVVGTQNLASGREPMIANHSSQGANYSNLLWRVVKKRIEEAHGSQWTRFALAAKHRAANPKAKKHDPDNLYDPMDCSMVRTDRRICLLLVAAVLVATVAGCGDGAGAEGETTARSGESGVLSTHEAKQLLRQLPYRYTFRSVATPDGAEAAIAGKAVGRHRTVVNFGIALGRGGDAVPVPRAGTRYAYGFRRGGFIFTSDELIENSAGRLIPNPQHPTAAQQNEASEMTVAMTDKLCRATTSEPCPP